MEQSVDQEGNTHVDWTISILRIFFICRALPVVGFLYTVYDSGTKNIQFVPNEWARGQVRGSPKTLFIAKIIRLSFCETLVKPLSKHVG